MTWAMAKSPALLQGYLDLSGALSRGVLSPVSSERIALAVAQRNNLPGPGRAGARLAADGSATLPAGAGLGTGASTRCP